jgi:hypothetical protein
LIVDWFRPFSPSDFKVMAYDVSSFQCVICLVKLFIDITEQNNPQIMATKGPDAIDRQVGVRVRMRRLLLDMSQEELAAGLGVSFQQVQKYA